MHRINYLKSSAYRRFAITLLLVALLPAVSTPALAAETATLPQSAIPRIDRDILLGFLADDSTMTLIDARSAQEYAEQHLPGAINIPFDAVAEHAGSLPEDPAKPVVVYCATGTRAGLLREQLLERGFTNVQVLPREQIHWSDGFMVFNCSTEPINATVDAAIQPNSVGDQQ